MAITTFDGYIASAKQIIKIAKTTSRTSLTGLGWYSEFDLAGSPGAGTLAGTSTAAGVVPDDTTAGCPTINAFGGSATGYLTRVDFGTTIACRLRICDLLFKAGAYAYNANTALSSQPSFSGRLPGGSYVGTEIWVETVTAATGNQTWNVSYYNQNGSGDGTKTTGAVGIGAAPGIGRMWQLPLAAGDRGVSAITNVAGGTGSAGTANILVLRPLWEGNVRLANGGDIHGIDKTGMPVVYENSALFLMICPDSTASGVPELAIEIANG